MTFANPADPYKLETQVLGWTESGERLEPFSLRFIKVVKAGVPEDASANPFNSIVRPISDYLSVPGLREWQEKMTALDYSYEKLRRMAYESKSYGPSFAGKK